MPDRDPSPSTAFTFSLFPSMVVQKDVDGDFISADLDYHTILLLLALKSILFKVFFLSSMFLGVSFGGFSSMAQSSPWCV